MKKHVIFSGILLALILSILTLINAALNAAAYFFLPSEWLLLITFVHMCVLISVLKTLGGKMNSTAKYSRSVFLLLFSPLSLPLSYLFGEVVLSERKSKSLKCITDYPHQNNASDCTGSSSAEIKARKLLSVRRGVYSHDKNTVRHFSCGREGFDALISALDGAERYIMLEFLIISSGVLLDRLKQVLTKKLAENVKVYIVYDRITTKRMFKKKDRKELKLAGAEIRSFDCKCGPFISNITDHRKLAVIDGKTVFTGGVNIGDEYADLANPCGKWKDYMLMISGDTAAEYRRMFDKMWQYLTGREAVGFDAGISGSGGAERGDNKISVFSNSGVDSKDLMTELLTALIGSAEKSVWISTPYLILDEIIENALRTAISSGVEVVIAVPGIPDKKIPYISTMSCLDGLVRRGAKGYTYIPGFLHSKYVIIDGTTVLTGSANLNQRSLYSDFECVALISGSAANDITDDFKTIIADGLLRKAEVRGGLQAAAQCAASLFKPLF